MNFDPNNPQPMLASYLQSAMIANQNENIRNFTSNRGLRFPCVTGQKPLMPPEYELNSVGSSSTTPDSKSSEKLSSLSSLSRSHQDLSRIDEINLSIKNNLNLNSYRLPMAYNSLLNNASPSVQNNMIEILRTENASLKNELEKYSHKVSKLQKFEIEIQKVHQAYEELNESCTKKEKLESTIRYRLETEVRKLSEQNKTLRDQLNSALTAIAINKHNGEGFVEEKELRNEIQQRDLIISQLLAQNKELINLKDRQEVELQAQRLTLEEQRNHIEILDNALKIAKLENNSQQTEKHLLEARNEKLKQINEIHGANKRIAQLENKLRESEGRLNEKDALIKILQHSRSGEDNLLQKSFNHRSIIHGRHVKSASSVGLTTSVNNYASNTGAIIIKQPQKAVDEKEQNRVEYENIYSTVAANVLKSKTIGTNNCNLNSVTSGQVSVQTDSSDENIGKIGRNLTVISDN